MAAPFPDAGFAGWMEHGMAAYMEAVLHETKERSPYFEMLMRTEVLENRLTTLAQRASSGYREWPGDIGMFLYGYAFLEYLSTEYGVAQLAALNRQQSQRTPVFEKDVFETVYGKSLDRLEQEWREALQNRYQAQIRTIQAQPVTETTALSQTGYFTNSPVFSPDGQDVYYIEESAEEISTLIRLHLSDQSRAIVARGRFSGEFSLSPDGIRLYFCQTATYKGWYEVSDLYLLNLNTGTVKRLTTGVHAFDPVIAPDGDTVYYTTNAADTTALMQMSLSSGVQTSLMTGNHFSRMRHPAVSPDGTKLAVQVWEMGGFEDIYILNRDGSHPIPVMRDRAMDASPAWGPNGGTLFFSSDRTGAPNILAYDLTTQTLYQVTNVLTGAFDPSVSPDGQHLVMEHYSGVGLDIHLVDLTGYEWKTLIMAEDDHSPASTKYAGDSQQQVRGYKPLASLLPDPMPAINEDAEGYMLGLTLSGKDMLEQHTYSLTTLYGLKSQDAAYEAEYINQQFFPTIRLFGYDLPEKYADIFRNRQANEEEYFERRQGCGVNLLLPLIRSQHNSLSLVTGYEYQKRSALTDLAALNAPLPDEGVLAGASVGLLFADPGHYLYPDERTGEFALLQYTRYDESFGSDFTLDTFTGALDINLELPFLRRHLVRFSVVGGVSQGERPEQGVFQLGGSFVKEQRSWEPKHMLSTRQFVLRGYKENTFVGDRVVVGTLEYRLPIWSPQRTLWGGRIFTDSLTASGFYETGDAWDNAERDLELKHSAGGELTLNFGLSYGKYPLSLGIGFAQGFDADSGKSQVYVTFGMGM